MRGKIVIPRNYRHAARPGWYFIDGEDKRQYFATGREVENQLGEAVYDGTEVVFEPGKPTHDGKRPVASNVWPDSGFQEGVVRGPSFIRVGQKDCFLYTSVNFTEGTEVLVQLNRFGEVVMSAIFERYGPPAGEPSKQEPPHYDTAAKEPIRIEGHPAHHTFYPKPTPGYARVRGKYVRRRGFGKADGRPRKFGEGIL
jgi:hypothetical protein